jgi:DNA replication and repair protein RecF
MLSRLIARHFRNFDALDLSVPPEGLVIVGENGQGKTNLLEAVAYLSLLRSMRGARDVDLIRFGAPALHVRAELAAPTVVHGVSVGFERATRRKKVALDGVEPPRLSDALGALPSVSFSPADVALVAGTPGDRRRFLDVTLALTSPAYLHALQRFRAALLRRNALLKQAQRLGARADSMADEVALWEPVLAEQGAVVAALRLAFVRHEADRFAMLAAAMGERQAVTMRYTVTGLGTGPGAGPAAGSASGEGAGASTATGEAMVAEFRERYSAALAHQRPQELRRGVTLVGPHRDELALLLGARELRTFGSAGQQRSAAIALRLLELSAVRRTIGGAPLLLLDDPFAELDLGRAARVLGLLEEAGVEQVLLAVPRLEDIPAAFTRLTRATMRDGVLS